MLETFFFLFLTVMLVRKAIGGSELAREVLAGLALTVLILVIAGAWLWSFISGG